MTTRIEGWKQHARAQTKFCRIGDTEARLNLLNASSGLARTEFKI
jgi:hypothetical protein